MTSPHLRDNNSYEIQKELAAYEVFDPSVYNNPNDSNLKKKLEMQKRYTREVQLGQGTYAVVYKGRDTKTGKIIAIKKLKPQPSQSGLDFSAIREIKTLKELKHPNVVELLDMISADNTLSLVLEYLESDLEKVIRDSSLQFSAADIKSWMLMLIKGLDHCHKNWILHRDLKPSNLLLAKDGQLKIGDFGLARHFGDPEPMSPTVVTIWYRSLELLFGAQYYSPAVDMWSVGTIFAELMLRKGFLPGDTEYNQVQAIYINLGVPTDEEWPEMKSFPNFIGPPKDKTYHKFSLRDHFKAGSDDALDLLSQFLKFNPNNRISAQDALYHHYFSSSPRPTDPSKLPKYTDKNSTNGIKRENSGDSGSSPSSKIKKEP